MMYMHYCKPCKKVHILNGHKPNCPRCDGTLSELRLSYLEYIQMTKEERKSFEQSLNDPANLAKIATTYRLYKYSKWYKELVLQASH